MKIIIVYDHKGSIKSAAFLGEGAAENLGFEPKPRERLITVDSADLPERVDESNLRLEQLAEYHKRIREKLQVVNGKVVRIKK